MDGYGERKQPLDVVRATGAGLWKVLDDYRTAALGTSDEMPTYQGTAVFPGPQGKYLVHAYLVGEPEDIHDEESALAATVFVNANEKGKPFFSDPEGQPVGPSDEY